MQTETMSKFPSAKVTTDVLYGKSFCVILRDHRLNVTEFTRIIDIEIRGRMDQDAYIEFRCEQLMDMIRSARMKNEYADIETKEEIARQPKAAGQFSYLYFI